jgi:hypothetical protein
MGAHNAGHAGRDEPEEQDGEACVDDAALAMSSLHLDDLVNRSHQRSGNDQHQPEAPDAYRLRWQRPRHLPHRGVKGRRTQHDVEEDPATVRRPADRPRAVELDQAEQHVRSQESKSRKGQHLHRPEAEATGGQKPGQHGEQHHIAKRVRHRDQLLLPGQLAIVDERLDQVDPGQQPQRRRDDQGVDQAGLVGPRHPGADEQGERGCTQRVHGQRQTVGNRGEGVVLVQTEVRKL